MYEPHSGFESQRDGQFLDAYGNPQPAGYLYYPGVGGTSQQDGWTPQMDYSATHVYDPRLLLNINSEDNKGQSYRDNVSASPYATMGGHNTSNQGQNLAWNSAPTHYQRPSLTSVLSQQQQQNLNMQRWRLQHQADQQHMQQQIQTQHMQQIRQKKSATPSQSGSSMGLQSPHQKNAAPFPSQISSEEISPFNDNEYIMEGMHDTEDTGNYHVIPTIETSSPTPQNALIRPELGFGRFQGVDQAKTYIERRAKWKSHNCEAPLNDAQLWPFAEQIYNAMINQPKIKYNPKQPDPQHWGAGQWTLKQIEARAWHVADLTRNLHLYGDNMWVAQGCKSRISMRDTGLNFRQRIDSICEILTHMHNTCTEVMNGQKLDILIPGPSKLLKRIQSNAQGNEKKRELLESGKKATQLGLSLYSSAYGGDENAIEETDEEVDLASPSPTTQTYTHLTRAVSRAAKLREVRRRRRTHNNEE